ncbi:hypothetical protein PF005_g21725 [Phytophthora fragariae]|uniref:Uncharacterized protein n=1 Tax=Phytophthora fragariae TaxID=53985 RepID=A0A6A3S5E1_9STRA|nr:hypothetical protein PF003_g32198 [Phytophthora fragariae]KAE8927371.1 hypothetical protein PF009_g22460 [Phytophthora fragariae]KAE8985599.1 hypothetical protein PF011_g20323 [Phytophthora fragariae]KAE9075975.1 hypothetical protein PF010_g24088 [Phytophthora fragariae]KAE9083979.1 hypothetical protein PF007_g21689 [Phytophthora fragariae]
MARWRKSKMLSVATVLAKADVRLRGVEPPFHFPL